MESRYILVNQMQITMERTEYLLMRAHAILEPIDNEVVQKLVKEMDKFLYQPEEDAPEVSGL